MSDINYSINPVDEKPARKYGRKKGQPLYDSIIDAFLELNYNVCRVDNTGRNTNYLASQLRNVCKRRKVDSVNISVRNKEVYLEKATDELSN